MAASRESADAGPSGLRGWQLRLAFEAILIAAVLAFAPSVRRSTAPADMSYFYGDEDQLRVVTPSARRIPDETYSALVQDTIVPCIDVVLEDVETRDLLLVKRSDEPMKGGWWLVGGRIRKGETFLDGALRKVSEEVGLSSEDLEFVGVLGAVNTFFNTSAHTAGGTQTINVVVHMRTRSRTLMLDREHHTGVAWTSGSLDPDGQALDHYVRDAIVARQRGYL
jgi:ADP-ribose pyrophosphatase YjhB (NUDIX family)